MNCKICGKPLKSKYDKNCLLMTLVSYNSPPGHNHDDNCITKEYICENGHEITLSVRNKCPNPDCDWVGKEECWCHPGEKLDKWPD